MAPFTSGSKEKEVNCRRLRVLNREHVVNSTTDFVQLRTESLDSSEPQQCMINLYGLWMDTRVKPGTIVHLIGAEYNPIANAYKVTNHDGLLVLDPDELMPCTFVVSSLYCSRKTWLGQSFNGWTSTNQAMLIGNMVHEVFQYACEHKLIDEDKLFQVLIDTVNNFPTVEECYSIGLDLETLLKSCKQYISSIVGWLTKYLLIGPPQPLSNNSAQLVKVQEILDIEETIWATKYGLKGKIDLTGVVKVHDKHSGTTQKKVLPLELKTGSQYFASSHVGQVSLYSFMIEDRHGATDQGLLIYLKNGPELHGIKVNHNHRRDLTILRNKLTEHIKDLTYGPEFKNVLRDCSRCERLLECVLMSRVFHPERLNSSSAMRTLEPDALGHLNEAHLRFFKYWIEILSEGISTSQKRARDANTFWTYESSQAESQGSGLSKLIIKTKAHKEDCCDESSSPSVQPGIVFERHPKYLESLGPLNAANLSRKRVAISIDDDDNRDLTSQNINIAKTTGIVVYGDKTSIRLLADNVIYQDDPDTIYRIDFVESTRRVTQQLTNILRLMYPIDWRYDHLRQILIPEDGKKDLKLALDLGGFIARSTNHITRPLDFDQKKFIVRAAISDDYYILDETRLSASSKISTTLTAFIKVVLHLNRTILVVASEFDSMNLMIQQMRIEKMDFSVIGSSNSDLKDYELTNQIIASYTNVENKLPETNSQDLESIRSKFHNGFERFDACKILITTYFNISRSPLLERRTFDYCMMFDCAKTNLPICLEPMFICDRYIIVDYRSDEKNEKDNDIEMNGTDSNDTKGENPVPSLGNYLRQLTSNG